MRCISTKWSFQMLNHNFFRRIVIETLKEVDGDRKCFNMVGGVLCERTVKEVLPILTTNQEKV